MGDCIVTWFGDEVTLKDGPQLDAFGRLRVSEPVTLFDSQQEYGLCTRRCWDGVVYNGTASYTITNPSSNGSVTDASGNAVGPRNTNTRMTPITTSSTNGHYAILQSRQYMRYIPGKSHLVYITGVFAASSGYSAKLVLRTATSGSVSDTNNVSQSSWNIDPFDGTGPSGITIDFTKTQIMVIQAQWLGVGRVVIGFDINGVLYPAHQFLNANVLTVPYTQCFNLPVRLEGQTVTTTTVNRVGYFDNSNGVFLETITPTAGGTINFICCSVQTEGGLEMRGFPRTASNGISTVAVTTRRPVLSIRPATTFNGLTNRAHIESDDIALSASSNSAYWEVVVGGTLTGASWTAVGTDSSVEYDTSATAITGGLPIVSGYAITGGGSTRGLSGNSADLRNPLTLSKINALTATQVPITIVCTSFASTSNVSATMNWHEQIV